MKKKISLLLVCFVVLLSLCSCKNPGITSENVSETVSENETFSMNLSYEATSSSAFSETTTSSESKTSQVSTVPSEPASSTQPSAEATEKEEEYITCTLQIDCSTIINNIGSMNESKCEFVPSDGKILAEKKFRVKKGNTAFDLLKTACLENVCADNCRFCAKNGIHLDYSYTPAYENYYIRGIHQIYEKDCGSRSGWMYCVNGTFPNFGSSSYVLKEGDKVCFVYTCDLGEDVA